MTNDELLIRIEDIYIITGRIYKGIKSDHSDSIVDFRSNNKEAVGVTYYISLRSTILRIKNIK